MYVFGSQLKSLAEHRNDYHKMGEAEQLLFQVTTDFWD